LSDTVDCFPAYGIRSAITESPQVNKRSASNIINSSRNFGNFHRFVEDGDKPIVHLNRLIIIDFVDNGLFVERIERQIEPVQAIPDFIVQRAIVFVFDVKTGFENFAGAFVVGLFFLAGRKKQNETQYDYPPTLHYSHSIVEGGLELIS
jgi:hypothetical protein